MVRAVFYSGAEDVSLKHEIVEPLLDLRQGFGTRPGNILISELDEHLREAAYGANCVHRIVFA